MFADRYIERNIIYPDFISDKPDKQLDIIVIIPCYREPEILTTLESLANCRRPYHSVEVIIVINQSEKDSDAISKTNEETIIQIKNWKEKNTNLPFELYTITPPPFPAKYAGAGMARKTGMDEAIRRFHTIDKPQGIIVSLDADTTVDVNYLIEIETFYIRHPYVVGTTLQFKHRTDKTTMCEKQIKGIYLYEKYLHYYKNALAFTGYPYPIFTIGSAFCCTAEAYTKQGGMNRRQAGEDFYFLHKLSQLGAIEEINTTCVYPLARLSDRVPFGTGPVLQRWLDGKEDLNLSYNFQSFIDLKQLFEKTSQLFRINRKDYHSLIKNLPTPLQQFLITTKFFDDLATINQHSAELSSFTKRFFQVFNAFKILKYINFSHENYYRKQSINETEKILALANKNKSFN